MQSDSSRELAQDLGDQNSAGESLPLSSSRFAACGYPFMQGHADDRFGVNLTGYLMDYDNLQVSQFLGTFTGFVITNAGKVRVSVNPGQAFR